MKSLIAPVSLAEHTPESYLQYIQSLRELWKERKEAKAKKARERNGTKKKAPFNVRKNLKGTLCLTMRRKPRYLTRLEVRTIIETWDLDEVWFWNLLGKREIKVIDEQTAMQWEEIPW